MAKNIIADNRTKTARPTAAKTDCKETTSCEYVLNCKVPSGPLLVSTSLVLHSHRLTQSTPAGTHIKDIHCHFTMTARNRHRSASLVFKTLMSLDLETSGFEWDCDKNLRLAVDQCTKIRSLLKYCWDIQGVPNNCETSCETNCRVIATTV